jgi:hypothetical protein
MWYHLNDDGSCLWDDGEQCWREGLVVLTDLGRSWCSLTVVAFSDGISVMIIWLGAVWFGYLAFIGTSLCDALW